MKALVLVSSLLISAMLSAPLLGDLIAPIKKETFNVQYMGDAANQIFATFVEKNKKTKQTVREDGGINYEAKVLDFSFLCVAFKEGEKTNVAVCYARGKGIQNFNEGTSPK